MRYGWFVVGGLFFLFNCSKHSEPAYARLIQLLPPRAQVAALADCRTLHQAALQLSNQLAKLPVVAQNPALMQMLEQMKEKPLRALSAFWGPLGIDWQTDLHWAALGLDLSGQDQVQTLLALRGHFPASIEQPLAAAAEREQKLGHAVYLLDQSQDLVLIRLDSEHLIVGQSGLALVALARWVDGVEPDNFIHQGFKKPTQTEFKLRLSIANWTELNAKFLSTRLPALRTLEQFSQVMLELSKRFELSVFCRQEQCLSDARLLLESLEQMAQSAVYLTQAWAYFFLASDIDALDVLPQPVQQVLAKRSSLLKTLTLLEPKSALSRISPLSQSQAALRMEGDLHVLPQLGILAAWVLFLPEVAAGFMVD